MVDVQDTLALLELREFSAVSDLRGLDEESIISIYLTLGIRNLRQNSVVTFRCVLKGSSQYLKVVSMSKDLPTRFIIYNRRESSPPQTSTKP